MTEKKKNGSGGKTRREFLKDAGLLVGGTAIGSTVLLAACGGGEETTKTVTQKQTETVTSTAGATTITDTVTSTTTVGAGATVTEIDTVTESRFICPIDGIEFDTLDELKAHFATAHPTEEKVPDLVILNVNGNSYPVQVKPEWSLAFVIREKLGMPGLKIGCDRGECGTCTVIANGRAVYACTMLAIEAEGMQIETVEGLSDGINLGVLQQAFVDNNAVQCGYCTPGFLMAAKALLGANPNPTRYDVREALSGHLCQCGNTNKFVEAVLNV